MPQGRIVVTMPSGTLRHYTFEELSEGRPSCGRDVNLEAAVGGSVVQVVVQGRA